jgi:hypothetical protein
MQGTIELRRPAVFDKFFAFFHVICDGDIEILIIYRQSAIQSEDSDIAS